MSACPGHSIVTTAVSSISRRFTITSKEERSYPKCPPMSSVCEELPQLYGGVAPPPISDTNPKGVGRQEGRLIRLERVCGVRGRLP